MALSKNYNLPILTDRWINEKGSPSISFGLFMTALAANQIGPLTSATDDATAKAAGVPINGLYENAGVVQIRKV
jgi:hypothetical protein